MCYRRQHSKPPSSLGSRMTAVPARVCGYHIFSVHANYTPVRALNFSGTLLNARVLRIFLALSSSYRTVFSVADRVHEAKSRRRRVGHTAGRLGPRRRARPLLSRSTLPRLSTATGPRPQRHCCSVAREGGQGKTAGRVAPGEQ